MIKLIRIIITLIAIILIPSNLLGQSLHVMSYNLRYDSPNDGVNKWENRKETMVALINYYHPDILGIQEGLHHQIEYLNFNLSNYEYVGVGRDDGKQQGEYAALFFDKTKYSVVKEGTFWLSDKSDMVSVGWDASMERICTYGLFENRQTGKKLWVFNTHYDHMGVLAREKSSELVLKKIALLNKKAFPVILMGDLNALPESNPIKQLKSKLDDGLLISKTALYGPSGTFTGFNPTEKIDRRIDYIFTSMLEVLSYRHINDKRTDTNFISDHLPVFAKIAFPETNNIK